MPATRIVAGRRRLLVIQHAMLGDAVMATPALRLLRSSLPDWHITVASKSGTCELLEELDSIDVLHVDDRLYSPDWSPAVARLRELASFDAALVLMRGHTITHAIETLGVPVIVDTAQRRPELGTPAYFDVKAREFVHLLGGKAAANDPGELELAVSNVNFRFAAEAMGAAGLDFAKPYVQLVIDASCPDKCWGVSRFAQLARMIHERYGVQVAITAAPANHYRARLCAVQAGGPWCAAPLLSVGALKAVVSQAEALVTNDTGTRHVAAALGVPRVTIFTRTLPDFTKHPTLAAWPGEAMVFDPRELRHGSFTPGTVFGVFAQLHRQHVPV